MPIIETENLRKVYQTADKEPTLKGTIAHFFRRRYKDVEAVKGATFAIEPGEIVGFLGPNGAGKTTTLKMLTGLICPTAGSVEVAGFTPFSRDHRFLRRITLVMGQKQQLIWDLPPRDSFRINAAVYDIPEPVFQERLAELAGMLELEGHLSTPVRKLSLGERMKAELLAALLHRPDVLFLDEPTLGLDVNAQVAVRQFLREYNRRYGATILLTSHYMADITALCERVLLIHRGSLIYDGGLAGILERFAPYREVRLELNDTDGVDFSVYGDVREADGRQVCLIIRRQVLAETVARLMREVPLRDLTITDPPIEEIIGRLFREGTVG